MNQNLSPHTQELLEQYRKLLPVYEKMADVILEKLKDSFDEAGIIVAAVEHRVKAKKSLAGKIQLKGDKYKDIFDITDLVGLRVITFYICRVPESSYNDPEHPEINKIRFEVQMRTVLQHAWANMNHDTGYKSGIGINLG